MHRDLKAALLAIEPSGDMHRALKKAIVQRLKYEGGGGRIGQHLPTEDLQGTLFTPVEPETTPADGPFNRALDELIEEGLVTIKHFVQAKVKPYLYVEVGHPHADQRKQSFRAARYAW